jgi:hypothetical protein
MWKILTFLLLPLAGISQTKGDNTIKIVGVTFTQVKAALLDSGYTISQQNTEDGTIVTKDRNVDKYRMFGSPMDRFHLIMYFRIKDSVAIVRGEWDFHQESNSKYQPLEYWKSKGSVPHAIFEVMDNFSKSFGKTVEYLKQ